jgi:hypothetical protein
MRILRYTPKKGSRHELDALQYAQLDRLHWAALWTYERYRRRGMSKLVAFDAAVAWATNEVEQARRHVSHLTGAE